MGVIMKHETALIFIIAAQCIEFTRERPESTYFVFFFAKQIKGYDIFS